MSKGKVINLSEGPIAKSIIMFALPLLGSSLVQQLYNTVDLLYVGNVLGTDAQAAVGASSLMITCLVGFFGGLSVGVSVVIANLFGAGRRGEVGRCVHTAAALSLLGGVLLSLFGYFLAPYFIGWIGTPARIVDSAVSYLRICFLSLTAVVSFNMGAGIIRAMGNSAAPMKIQLAGGITNVVMDAVFIYVFDMGVDGVAWATLISQGLAAVLVVIYLCRMDAEYRLTLGKIRLHGGLVVKILRIGVPAGLQALVITLSNVVAQYHINSFDTAAIAAFTNYWKVELPLYMPIVAIGQAATTFVGQCLGAGKAGRAKKGTKVCVMLGVIITACTAVIMLLVGKWAFWLFNRDGAVIENGLKIIAITFPFYWIYDILEIYGATIRGAGRTSPPMIIILSNICILRTILLFVIMYFWHDLRGIAMTYPITWSTTAICMYLYYRSGKWQMKEENKKTLCNN